MCTERACVYREGVFVAADARVHSQDQLVNGRHCRHLPFLGPAALLFVPCSAGGTLMPSTLSPWPWQRPPQPDLRISLSENAEAADVLKVGHCMQVAVYRGRCLPSRRCCLNASMYVYVSIYISNANLAHTHTHSIALHPSMCCMSTFLRIHLPWLTTTRPSFQTSLDRLYLRRRICDMRCGRGSKRALTMHGVVHAVMPRQLSCTYTCTIRSSTTITSSRCAARPSPLPRTTGKYISNRQMHQQHTLPVRSL